MRTDSPSVEAGWAAVKSGGRRAVARIARRVLPDTTVRIAHVEAGVRLRVSMRRNVMFWSGGLSRYEIECVRVIRAAVEPGDIAIDAGANIGFFTTLLSKWVGPNGRVAAVEPDVDNLRLLRRNLDENACDNVRVMPCAVGETSGEVVFSRDRATGATGHVGEGVTAGEEIVGRGRIDVVPMRIETLDAIAEDAGGRVAFVKIDIEGHESAALAGASRLLSEHRPILVTELGGDLGSAAAELLRSHDYRLWDIESGRLIDSDVAPFLALALPSESIDSERSRRTLRALEGGAS